MVQVRVSIVRETSLPSSEQEQVDAKRRWRRVAALGSVMTLAAVALVGSAGANPATTDTTDVAFVAIPAKQVMGNVYIAAGKTYSVAVIDGATTVPSNATTVRLLVTVKGTKAGALKLYPAGNPAGTSGDIIPWAAGGTATSTVAENVGMTNKVTVENTSLAAATVTVKITGYSTQVTAGDINGSGGTNDQVLTNNGTGGAEWRTPQPADAPAYAFLHPVGARVSSAALSTSLELFLPAGSYHVIANGSMRSLTPSSSTITCKLFVPDSPRGPGGPIGGRGVFATSANQDTHTPLSMQGLVNMPREGNVEIRCNVWAGSDAYLDHPSLTAARVGTLHGDFLQSQH